MQTNDASLVGNYTIDLVGRFYFSRGVDYRDERVQFNITLRDAPASYTGDKYISDYFTVPDHSMVITEGWTLQINDGKYVYGDYGDKMDLVVNLGPVLDFARFDELT